MLSTRLSLRIKFLPTYFLLLFCNISQYSKLLLFQAFKKRNIIVLKVCKKFMLIYFFVWFFKVIIREGEEPTIRLSTFKRFMDCLDDIKAHYQIHINPRRKFSCIYLPLVPLFLVKGLFLMKNEYK